MSSYSSSADAGRQHRGSHGQFPEQVIGSYAIGETIGRGSFGKVKKGRHIHTGETVAIKILNRQKLKSANMDKKIHREIEILQLFSHPNICRLYEVISTPTDMYLIMEHVEGGELYDYIVQKGRVREAEARYIFQQLVCALEYCHHFRVVHRDLKPENVLLGPGLQVKLIDFGLSNIMKDGEFLATSCGSPNYAAPEVISGKLYFGPEVDVWSCGVILYALHCGCLPFDEESIPLLFSKIKKGKYSIPSSLPAGPRELIQQILIVDPLVRLTIPQIRDNFWFNQKLPLRLTYNESLFTAQEDRIQSVLANEAAKRLGVREKDVRREIEKGSGPAYVAYNILLDAMRRKEITAEVRELGINAGEDYSAASGGTPHASYTPKAMERELNLGLMLTQSPAMEMLLDHGDASFNKEAYNSGVFVPASAAHEGRMSSGMEPASSSAGSFRMKAFRSGSSHSSQLSSSAQRGGSFLNTGAGSSVSQLGAGLAEQPRVGSVARKHAMYTADEQQFLLSTNAGWRVGLMTDWHAERALQNIYEVLRLFHMEWKVLSPFHLRTRTTQETWTAMNSYDAHQMGTGVGSASSGGALAGSSSRSAPIPIGGSRGAKVTEEAAFPSPATPSSLFTPPASPVIMSIHLFRMHEKHDRGYLVDFTLEHNAMCGFSVLLRVYTELAVRVS